MDLLYASKFFSFIKLSHHIIDYFHSLYQQQEIISYTAVP